MPPKPRDRRDYVRVAVDLPDNPKLAAIDDPRAGWLMVTGLCYAGANLTDGHIPPRVVERRANVPAKWTRRLVEEGIWHEPGHDCERCPQPRKGEVFIHDFGQHQTLRAEREKARSDAEAAAAARWAKKKPKPDPDTDGNADRNAKGIPPGNAGAGAESYAKAESKGQRAKTTPSLLTFVSRLAASDASVSQPPPAEVIESWREIAGPGVDLEAEARAYLARNGDRPARDERGAWLGWLRKAREREALRAADARLDPDADIRPPEGCGRPGCIDGYLGYDHEERPIPCPACRPHLRAVGESA